MAKVFVIVSAAIRAFRESVQLQGARGLDLERAGSGDTSDEEVPELWLNMCLVLEVFVQILATGVGTLAFIWATVVLLGGFSTFLHKVDFWVITGIVFIEAAKVVGLNSNTEARFFAQVPPASLELGIRVRERRKRLRGDASGRNLYGYIMIGLWDFISFMALLTSVLLLLPLVAASSCFGLSFFRLIAIMKHNQYRDSGADDSKANVLRALIFFYALVLAQGVLFLICQCITSNRFEVRDLVCSEYHFEGKDEILIDKYIDRTKSACIRTGVLNTINRKLVSFAVDLLHSEYRAERVSGVQVLHTLTSVANDKPHKDRAVAQIQSSPDCISRMLVLLSSESGIDENSKVNLALIITRISKELRLSDIDGATESISSLIDPYLTKISAPAGSVSQQGISQTRNMQNDGGNNQPLIIHGLEILAMLARKNPDNCRKIFSTKDLFPKIIAPISNKLYTVFTRDGTTIEITRKSLQVVSKLVKGTHDINREIRHEICGKGLVMNRIYPILKSEETRYKRLKVPAIKILSQLALVNIVGDDIMVNYIHHLLGLLLDDSNDNESISIKKAAAKALLLLAMDSKTYCATIMNWRTGPSHSVVQQLSDMLTSGQSYRNAVAQLLTQFCLNSTETTENLKSILPQVLSVIISEDEEALDSTNQQSNSQRQNRRPAEVILEFVAPCLHISSGASRGSRQGQGASQHLVGASGGNRQSAPATPLQALSPCLGTSSPPNQSGNGGNTVQNQTAAGSQSPRDEDGGPVKGVMLSVLRHVNKLVNARGAYNIDRHNRSNHLGKAGSMKTLVAFLPLALQICDKLSDEAAFDAAVPDGVNKLVDKLDKIIGICNKDSVGLLKGRGPSVGYLMMIKSATKLCASVMRTKPSSVAYFRDKDMDQKLEGALEAMSGLELGVLLTSSAEELTNYEKLSSIVEDATRPIIQSRQTAPPLPPPPPPPRPAVCCFMVSA